MTPLVKQIFNLVQCGGKAGGSAREQNRDKHQEKSSIPLQKSSQSVSSKPKHEK